MFLSKLHPWRVFAATFQGGDKSIVFPSPNDNAFSSFLTSSFQTWEITGESDVLLTGPSWVMRIAILKYKLGAFLIPAFASSSSSSLKMLFGGYECVHDDWLWPLAVWFFRAAAIGCCGGCGRDKTFPPTKSVPFWDIFNWTQRGVSVVDERRRAGRGGGVTSGRGRGDTEQGRGGVETGE